MLSPKLFTSSMPSVWIMLSMAFAMGVLFFGLEYYEQAMHFFERSLDTHGPSAAA